MTYYFRLADLDGKEQEYSKITKQTNPIASVGGSFHINALFGDAAGDSPLQKISAYFVL
jgi:hypothetical protein